MFRKKSKSESARERAHEVAEHAATQLKSHLKPAVDDIASTAKDKKEHARSASVAYAAPKVEHLAEALAPQIDSLRDKIVDDLLPRLVDSVHHAAEGTTESTAAAAGLAAINVEQARDGAGSAVKKMGRKARKAEKLALKKQAKFDAKTAARLAKESAQAARKAAKAERKASGGRKIIRKSLFVLTAAGAAGAAGYALWKQSQPKNDPWVTSNASAATGGTAFSPESTSARLAAPVGEPDMFPRSGDMTAPAGAPTLNAPPPVTPADETVDLTAPEDINLDNNK